MKTLKMIACISTAFLLAAGCDFVRATLGKPTSAYIQFKRDSISAAEQARIDSAILAQKLLAEQEEAARYNGIPTARYNIIAGAFRDSLNAVTCMNGMNLDSIKPRLIHLRSNFTAVSLYASDDLAQASEMLSNLQASPDFKVEVCLYDAVSEIAELERKAQEAAVSPQDTQTIQIQNL